MCATPGPIRANRKPPELAFINVSFCHNNYRWDAIVQSASSGQLANDSLLSLELYSVESVESTAGIGREG